MRTEKIVFDETYINEFMAYSEEYIKECISHYTKSNYMYANPSKFLNEKDIKMLAVYFATRPDKYSCNNIGQTFIGKEEISSIPSMVWFTDGSGRVLTRREDIIQNEREEFDNDRKLYIKEHLFDDIWCDIERVLRFNYEGKADDYDKRLLNNAKIYAERHAAQTQ